MPARAVLRFIENISVALRVWHQQCTLWYLLCGAPRLSFQALRRLEVERTQGREATGPKHGKASDGKAHVGGNTWAGGTGGADTAGQSTTHPPA